MVDDSARDRDALLLAARQLVGPRSGLVRETDEVEHLRHLLADRGAGLALHLERVGDVLVGARSRRSLKSWNTQPTLRRSSGTFQRFSRPRSRPPTMMRPVVGSSSFSSSRMIVDLPDPDGPTTNTNSPLSIVNEMWSSAVTSGS